MPLTMFRCPLDSKVVHFDFCRYNCPSRCLELPILLSFMEQREVVPFVYSITEILKPPRVVNYNRQVGHSASPFDLVFMSLGSAFHEVVAGNGMDCPNHLFERKLYFESPVYVGDRTIILRGQPDQYDLNTETLTDYKTAAYYPVKLLMEGKWDDSDYRLQVNLYRRYKFPNCQRQQLVFLIKDYSRKLKHEGVPPIVTIQVPKIEDDELDREVKVRLFDILEGESDWRKSRDCSDQERWKNKKSGEYVRCEDYCMVKDVCPQFIEKEAQI